MSLSFCSFSSGSSGNCYMIKNSKTALLVDVGISGKRIIQGLEQTNTKPEQVEGIFITHEHSDHIKSLKVIGKKIPGSAAYANAKTWQCIEGQMDHQLAEERKQTFVTGKTLSVGSIGIKPFPVSHDAAEPVGFSFFCENKQISIVTDTGYITKDIFSEIKNADLIVLEANHEVKVLEFCSYPYHVKRRILGKEGHLSNESAAECICRLIKEQPKKRKILLGHLSNENNTPDLAYMTIKNILEEEDIYIGDHINMEVISRDIVSDIYRV